MELVKSLIHTFEKDDSSKPWFSISFSLNSLPTSLSGKDSSSMPRAVSLAWTGMPYSRSSRHTWHTFFAFATSWQMMVALYLYDSQELACKIPPKLQPLHAN